MIKTRILYLLIFLLMACSSSPSNTINAEKYIGVKNFYVEFSNKSNETKYEQIISKIKKELFQAAFIASREKNDWQGIKKVSKTDQIKGKEVSEYHPQKHCFLDISEYDTKDKKAVKIIISLHSPLKDSIFNFNFRAYQKRGHPEWQSAFNPGTFRYKESHSPTEAELADWMIHHIVLLTFK